MNPAPTVAFSMPNLVMHPWFRLTTIHFVWPNWLLGRTYVFKLGVPSGKCQRGEFVNLLRNVPIKIFAICYIIVEVYNGFRYRKWWHTTLENQRVPKTNLWIIDYCILEIKVDNEPAISLPDQCILSLSKNENMFNEKNTTKQKDQKKKKKNLPTARVEPEHRCCATTANIEALFN